MPSIHISESVFKEYVDRAGGYEEAKAEIKTVVAAEVKNHDG